MNSVTETIWYHFLSFPVKLPLHTEFCQENLSGLLVFCFFRGVCVWAWGCVCVEFIWRFHGRVVSGPGFFLWSVFQALEPVPWRTEPLGVVSRVNWFPFLCDSPPVIRRQMIIIISLFFRHLRKVKKKNKRREPSRWFRFQKEWLPPQRGTELSAMRT